MVWYFNFCSPHLNDDSSVNLNRTMMVIEIVIAMLITFIVHMLAELYDEESSRGNTFITQSRTKPILLKQTKSRSSKNQVTSSTRTHRKLMRIKYPVNHLLQKAQK